MSFDDEEKRELEYILASMGTDAFDARAKDRMAELVNASDEARRIYLEHCQMQAMLHQSSLLASFKAEQSADRVAVSPPASRRPIASWPALVVAACLLFVVGAATATYFRNEVGGQSLTELPFALVESVNGVASFKGSTLVEGEELSAGPLRVESGSVDLSFDHGTALLIEGPTELTIDNDMQVTLKRGKVAARVSEAAHGFTVLGPDAAVVDLGTEFSMAVVDSKGWVEVYDGEVDIALLDQDGHAWKSRLLTATGAVRIDAANGSITDDVPPTALPRFSELSMEGLDVPAEYIEAVLASEPVHFWRFEEANDRQIADVIGEAAAVLNGGVQLKNGALYFPRGRRNHGFVFVAEPSESLLNAEFSIETWAKPSFSQHSVLVDINRREPTSKFREKLHRITLLSSQQQTVYPKQTFRFHGALWPYGDKESVSVFSAAPYDAGAWHHVVAVRRSDRLEIYLNGQAAQTVPMPPLAAEPLPATISIGRFSGPQGRGARPDRLFYKGLVDEVAIYDRAMSAKEINEHYQLMQVKAE